MPELPEVETVCKELRPLVLGQVIEKVVLRRSNIRFEIPKDLPEICAGLELIAIARRGKYMIFKTNGAYSILAHLGMSGSFTVVKSSGFAPQKHDHALFYLNNGAVMVFNDPRRFGMLTVLKNKDVASHKLLKNLGIEPLDKNFDARYLRQYLARRKSALKVALMDQKLVVGVGNIYACESLFLSKISPVMKADKVTLKQAESLVRAIKKVLKQAIESNGSTYRDFVRTSGEKGGFQHHFSVYDREGKPCKICRGKIARIVQGGRSTFYCPNCQA